MPRPGYLTASTFPDLMTGGRKGEEFGKTAMRHIERLALDLLGFTRDEDFGSAPTDWGKEHEDTARFLYEMHTLQDVRKAPFRAAKDTPYVGGTMDGKIGKVGGLEIKCPKLSAIHVFRVDEHYADYKYQVQGYIWIYGLEWCDFVSYDPRGPITPENMQLRIQRIEPDTGIIDALKERCALAHAKALKLVEIAKQQHRARSLGEFEHA